MAMKYLKNGFQFLTGLIEKTISDEIHEAETFDASEHDMVYVNRSIVDALLAKQNDMGGDEQIIAAYQRANGDLKAARDEALEECAKVKSLAVSLGAVSVGLAILLMASVMGWLS